jgi:hypothetical protein
MLGSLLLLVGGVGVAFTALAFVFIICYTEMMMTMMGATEL